MYLDTAVLVKLLVPEPDSAFYASLVDGETAVVTSQVAVVETYSALLREQRKHAISKSQADAAWRQLHRYVETGSLRLVSVTADLLERTVKILDSCQPHIALRTLDAIHLASCLASRSGVLVTSDRVMRKAAKQLGLKLSAHPGR